MSTLICPKCGSDMRSYERNQVHVDQCTGCGGLFLDRGELEALVNAEAAYYAAPAPQAQQAPPQQTAYGQGGYGQPAAQSYGHAPRYSSSPRKGSYGQQGHGRRKSFLGELFD